MRQFKHSEPSKFTASKYCYFLAFRFGLPFKIFKTCLLERDFRTLLKNVLFSSPTNVGSHNPLP